MGDVVEDASRCARIVPMHAKSFRRAQSVPCHDHGGGKRLGIGPVRDPIRTMWKSDIICRECGAGYRRIEITPLEGAKGEYRCQMCGRVLEAFDGTFAVLIRLTVAPVRSTN